MTFPSGGQASATSLHGRGRKAKTQRRLLSSDDSDLESASVGHAAPRRTLPAAADYIMAPPPKNERYYLKPTKVKEPDEWPEFLLDEVLVTDGRQKPISLLEATVNNGVVVHGLLRKVKDEDEDLVRHEISETGNPIILPNVELFAYQRDMDGTIDFWAASKSGWFKMVGPSKAYQSVYDDMEQAVTLLRFLEGLHPEEPPNSRGSLYPTLDEIFEEYTRYDLACQGLDDAASYFHKHRDFIFNAMLSDDVDGWTKTPIFNHLKQVSLDTSKRIKGQGRVVEEPVEVSSDDSSQATPGKRPSRRSKHRSKGLLRPKIGPSSKRAARQTLEQARAEKPTAEESSAGEEISLPVRSRVNGAVKKRAKYAHEGPRGEDQSPVFSLLPIFTETTPPSPLLPRAAILRAMAQPIPPATATGPQGMWQCWVEGCKKKLRSGETPEGRARVREHLKEHDGAQRERLDLARQEAGSHRPIDHLIDRIREIAALRPVVPVEDEWD